MTASRLRQRRDPEIQQQEHRRRRAIQISTKTLRPDKVQKIKAALDTKFGSGQSELRHEELLLDLDRADVRQNGRQQRDHRDHRLAAGDLRLHRAALRVEVRDTGADRADARPADHGRRLLADRARSDDLDGRGAADDPRVFALRHDHRVRSCARERAANAARGLLADRQPIDVRGADADRWRRASARCCRCSRCCCSAAKRSRTSPSR